MKKAILAIILGLTISNNASAILIHHYDFSTDASDLIGGANGTLFGGANVSGGMLNLDGINDYVQIDSQIVPTSGSYTVALFLQQTSVQNIHTELISQGFSGGPGFYLGHNPSGNIRASDSWGNTGIAFPSDAQFHHLSLVVDAIGSESLLYVDGLLQTTLGAAISTTNAGSNTRFGRQFDPFSEYFRGSLDDIRIYDSALTASDISNLANNASPVPAPAAVWLLGSGLIGLARMRKNSKKHA